MTDKLLVAASNAAALLLAMYEWSDRVEKAGGTTSIEGIAVCHAMLKTMKKNRPRVNDLIIDPLNAAIEERKGAKE